ncbi:manganese efflux pump MntP family protein [Oceanobacillus polygoni]|uniref:Putative manganese efflux pump MntP n=1 Tax=Oceanobacillus polygoni TaxID=1235259 RepID=A0A9X1CEK0_9BACI|nr:manganese efflux pump MntP family protein [Oceanobacillus polygoni]MBP2076228.1 putative Mn2+ efflux pump MntP [Oceanobacillus polygoni]
MSFSGEIVSLFVVAIAIGMDAFSISLGLGLVKLRLKRIAFVGMTIGIFHIIMPFFGMVLGKAISEQIGDLTTLASGALLFFIGAQMFFSAFSHEAQKRMQPVGLSLLLIAFTVSLDSFTVGLGLGISGVRVILTLILFGVASAFLACLGMLLGRKVQGYLGVYSELLAGSILCCFGIYMLFG